MKKIKLPAKMENLEKLIDFILEGVQDFTNIADKKIINRLRLSCEEALVNVINYSYPQSEGEIEVSYDIDEKGAVHIEIIDWGVPFDPLSKPAPDLDLPLEERQIGGLGIYMILKIMDEVKYRRDEERNILTMVKYKIN